MNILKSEGAEPMQTEINDPFDYSQHEALTFVEKEDVEENTIVDVIQDGWKFKKEVLRYAKVVISKKPKPPEPIEEKAAEKKEKIEKGKTDEKEEKVETDSDKNSSKTKKSGDEPVKKPDQKADNSDNSGKNEYIS
jgi:hypothetical protein